MTNADLDRKFHGLVAPVLGGASAERLLALCALLPGAPDVHALVGAARPGPRPAA